MGKMLGKLLDVYIDKEHPWVIILETEECSTGYMLTKKESNYFEALNKKLELFKTFIGKNVYINGSGNLVEL